MRRTMIAVALLVIASSAIALAGVPRTMNYQGVLRDDVGVPVPDGDYELTFRIYDVEFSGGALWAETNTVAVTEGIFNATLGKNMPLTPDFDTTYWLGIEVESEGELAPRVELSSAPYAFRAAVADSLVPGTWSDGDWVVSGNDVYRLTGNVGIGTAAPDWKLTIHKPAGDNLSLTTGGGAYARLRLQSYVADEWFTIDGNWGGLRLSSPQDIFVVPGADRKLQLLSGNLIVDVGRVGIGTGTPGAKLHITGTPGVDGILFPDGTLQTTAGTGSLPPGVSGSTLRHTGTSWTANTLLYNNGINVGVGTTSPTQVLTVNGKLQIGDDGAAVSAGAMKWDGSNFQGYDGSTWRALDAQPASGGGWTDTGAVVRLTTTTDRVGIGTTSPDYILDIQRTGFGSFASRTRIKGYANTLRPSAYLRLGKSRGSIVSQLPTASGDTLGVIEGAGVNFNSLDAAAARIVFIQPDAEPTDFVPGSITFETSDGWGAPQERMTVGSYGTITMHGMVDMTGNMISNVLDPVSGSDAATRDYVHAAIAEGDYDWTVTGTDDMYSTVSGNVGIGTTTPAVLLHVNGDQRVQGRLEVGADAHISDTLNMSYKRIVHLGEPTQSTDATTKNYVDNLTGAGVGGSGTANRIAMFTASKTIGDAVIVQSGTNIGVGTTSAQNKLDVEGAVAVGGVYSGYYTAPSDGMIVQGNVGIGTSTPASKLGVSGEMAVGNVYAGTNAAPSNGMIVQGNVGLGTPNPNYDLEVNGTAGFSEYVYHSGDNDTYIQFTGDHTDLYSGGNHTISAGTAAVTVNPGVADMDFVALAVGAVTGLRVDGATGNVSIGTSTVGRKLSVAGEMDVSGALYARDSSGIGLKDDAGTLGLWVEDGGQVGIGTTSPTTALDVNGTTKTATLQITGGSDLAEPFEMSGRVELDPGSVVVIDERNPGNLRISSTAYDRRVAGIVSGAGGLNPGVTLSQAGGLENGQEVALAGRAWCLADASFGPIEPGDRLTTSDTHGHAMRVADNDRAVGAVIGKAMTSLAEGRGLVLVLVQPQ